METEAKKLVALVQARPALYNHDLNTKQSIDQLWNEVANELNSSATDCRLKWHTLRSCYSRHLRDMKRHKLSGSTSSKKKKWYMADSMSFLEKYLRYRDSDENSLQLDEVVVELKQPSNRKSKDSNQCNSGFRSNSSSSKPTSFTKHVEKISDSQLKEEESHIMNFFRGVLPDIERLAPKRQRIFKMELLQLVNKLADEEEDESSNVAYPPSVEAYQTMY